MTKKQERWQRRGRLLWRLKGITGFDLSPGIVTPSEQELLTRALWAYQACSGTFNII